MTTDPRDPARPRNGTPAGLSRQAFADLLEASADSLWTVAAGVLGGPSEAEDVLQEAALSAWTKLEQFEPGTSFLAWMGAFVRNHARNRARLRQRQATRGADPERLVALAREADARSGRRTEEPLQALAGRAGLDALEGRESQDAGAFDDALDAALGSLAPLPRTALLLRFLGELSYAEIGQALGIPEGTAASHVSRARTQLRTQLEAAPNDRTTEARDAREETC